MSVGGSGEPLYFEASARLQKFLGRELIADPNLAIVEFVKNSYDAGARNVEVLFRLAGRSIHEQEILIRDDGHGMTLPDFRDNWMRPGYSEKAKHPTRQVAGRTRVGEKGVGRLAAARLGNELEIHTRARVKDPWLHVPISWHDFDNMDKALNAVPISWGLLEGEIEDMFSRGTQISIRDLTLAWDGKVPGRKVAGRSDWRLGRLRQELSLLLYGKGEEDFIIDLQSDLDYLKEFHGIIDRDQPDFASYVCSFEVRQERESIVIVETLQRSAALRAERSDLKPRKKEVRRYPLAATKNSEEVPRDVSEKPESLRCGPFTGTLVYAPPQLREQLGWVPGVRIYRDQVRVEPYGNLGDDWLGAFADKAARQGHAAIQPRRFGGHIDIGKQQNRDLIDMSNRAGLVENEAYQDFLTVCQLVYRDFASRVYDEFVEPGWDDRVTTKAEASAERARGFAAAFIKARVHAVRQPLGTVGGQVERLRILARRKDLPPEVKTTILEIAESLMSHMDELDRAVDSLSDLPDVQDVQRLDLASSVEEAIAGAAERARELGVVVSTSLRHGLIMTAPKGLLVETICEAIRNGAEASHASHTEFAAVSVELTVEESDYLILVRDNGGGTDGRTVEQIISLGHSDKGRPGHGLDNMRTAVGMLRGSIRFAADGDAHSKPGWTTLVMRLPREASNLKG